MGKKNKQFVEKVTAMEEDFAQWYTDVVKQAELVEYGQVRGTMIIKPYGYAIWENIKDELDKKFKETGHSNVAFPLFIPESLLQKEKDHVEGFAPEVAWVTHGGEEELTERIAVRPTSEVLFCDYYSNNIHSYRDLPKLYNQWGNVVRWEKTTRPFLRSSEFHWQEGHTAHATDQDAAEETDRMLGIYADLVEKYLAIPVLKGRKTDKEKFAGAKYTLTIESMMHDGKALQSGTSHHFGSGFAEAFDITYLDENGKSQYVHQTSWGLSTRIMGALIMVHGDNRGLVIPPRIAPIQAMIVPIAQHKEGVLDKAYELRDQLKNLVRVDIDASDKTPGWKFNETEMKGFPVRIEMGPKDIEKNQVVLVRRDTGEKEFIALAELQDRLPVLLEEIQQNLYEKAKAHREEKTSVAKNMDEFKAALEENPGFIKAMWCGDTACEEKIKEETTATSRCIPFEQEKVSDTCVCCGKEAKELVYWAKAY
ncbi:proline--tRNA ligase [Virgibacillus halodenitrificans]|uniref:proline--tRNA ligase n=1 Tax=Virgibacillus halodenitrificans TaxID=1482 RepID=UPI0007612A7A|nr:proline--tRNA ligase [Virgibacillus halodenitrificans]MCG1027347.1 proline--tRNA ligase [Virgibacillus halodenitrificans]MCJ0930356.1 proline--tRNA ligase [Virgibacillus halodenitrificans]MEC2159151.1 proline--tRNA ligase [Virgibacillus halodenitrificans]MYL58186.1 proline--tRNA ligase [Virgibacillus halodenitrificans]